LGVESDPLVIASEYVKSRVLLHCCTGDDVAWAQQINHGSPSGYTRGTISKERRLGERLSLRRVV
ncbi:hypothetical protein, partial [Parabacteroides distasonis]|uniref:hypothetical protein n=1 Tax=Parabacteroides distasonis TaxID=823 RepID=UPI001BDEB2EE